MGRWPDYIIHGVYFFSTMLPLHFAPTCRQWNLFKLKTRLIGKQMISFIYAAIITVAVNSGYGSHADTLSSAQFIRAKKFNLASFIPGLLAIVVPKLAVVALLVRTMNPSVRQKWILWGSAGGSGMLLMGCVVILYAQCRPVWVMWTPVPKIENGVAHCWPLSILVDYSIVVGGEFPSSPPEGVVLLSLCKIANFFF